MYTLSDFINGMTLIQILTAFCFASLFANSIGKLFSKRNTFDDLKNTIDRNQYLIKECETYKNLNDEESNIINRLQALNRQLDACRENAAEYQQVTPVCFDYACLISGFYGLFCLWIFPIIKVDSSIYGNLYAWGSIFFIIPTVFFCIIETLIRRRNDKVIKKMNSKHYKCVLFTIFLIYICAYLCTQLVKCQIFYPSNSCIWYHITLGILIIPYVKCFIFYCYDEHKLAKIEKNIEDKNSDFDQNYANFKRSCNK